MKRKLFSAFSLAVIFSLLITSLALADNTVADGDNTVPVVSHTLDLGTVCINSTKSGDVLVGITRNGDYTHSNVFKKGTTAAIAVFSSTSGLSAVMGSPNTISIPSNWDTVSNNTVAGAVSSTVTFGAGSATGAFTGTVTFRSSGTQSDDTLLARDGNLVVTALVSDTGDCAPPSSNTAPTDPGTPYLSSGLNPNNTGEFTLSWTASTDAEDDSITYLLQHKDFNDASFSAVASGLTTNSYTFDVGSPEAEGTWTYRVQASDGSLTSAFSGDSTAIVVDMSDPLAPSLAADRSPDYAGDGGWYLDTVTISSTDNGDPDLLDGSAGSGVDPNTVTPTTFYTSGSQTASDTVFDFATNESTEASLSVQVDADKPTVQIVCPAGEVILGSSASASWTASDGESGLATAATGSVALDTSATGSKTATAPTATDNVGHNSDAATCSYSVIYNWNGFFQPIDNLPIMNKVKAGSAIPVKFSLSGYQGLSIFWAGYPVSTVTACGNTATDTIETTVTAGSSSLSYDATADQYNYVWKTDKAWAGYCRTLTVKLSDGTIHQANFTFTK